MGIDFEILQHQILHDFENLILFELDSLPPVAHAKNFFYQCGDQLKLRLFQFSQQIPTQLGWLIELDLGVKTSG